MARPAGHAGLGADLGALPTFTSALKRAGYWTGYATDNPFLGYADPYRRFRSSFDRFARVGGQLGRVADTRSVSRSQVHAWLVPELRDHRLEERLRRHIAAGGRYWEDENRSWAARVFGEGARSLEHAASHQPFALVVDTYEPHEPWTPPREYIDLYGDPSYRGPEPATSRYGRVDSWLSRGRAPDVLGRMRDLYAAEVTMTDRRLGLMLRAWESSASPPTRWSSCWAITAISWATTAVPARSLRCSTRS